MQLRFEVNVGGHWTPVKNGIVLADGRLGCDLGVVPPPYWVHSEETTSQPEFRKLCFSKLTPEERQCAVSRLGGLPVF